MKQFINIKAAKIILLAFILFAAGTTNAQIGIGITNPAASAQLDVVSTSKGFLPPRMTMTQRDAIQGPAPGLMIWCNDCGATGETQVYNGYQWTNMLGGGPKDSVVIIGTKAWMPRNLEVATYRNGEPVTKITNAADWAASPGGAWCYYEFKDANAAYGKLYNRYAVTDPRGLAPVGWRIPGKAEWEKMATDLGGGSVAADKLRSASLWSTPGSNASGFTGLPGGQIDIDGVFQSIGVLARWWIPGQIEHIYPSHDNLTYYFSANLNDHDFSIDELLAIQTTCDPYTDPPDCVTYNFNAERFGFSVRCVTDEPSVTIGSQVWTSKNLDVAKYRNGDPIPQVTDPFQWANLTTGAWCYYDNNPANGAVYGKLYNWYAVHDPRGLAPQGYHIPGDEEWTTLTNYLGGETVAGGKMKYTDLWDSPNTEATNESGFTALPAGYRNYFGPFSSKGAFCGWWSFQDDPLSFLNCYLTYDGAAVIRSGNSWAGGLSVRCIRD